jgi:hypothetical protein
MVCRAMAGGFPVLTLDIATSHQPCINVVCRSQPIQIAGAKYNPNGRRLLDRSG